MEDDIGVRELLKLIFGKKPTIPAETVALSPIPSDMLNEDFLRKFEDFLCMHKFITYDKWIHYFDNFYLQMLYSHQMYLAGLIYNCLYEHKYSRNIFDSFVCAFLLVMNMSNEVLTKSRIDYRNLNPDIIMVFYRNILKSSFLKQGGFYGFVEYVRGHKYFEWNWEEKDLNLSDSQVVFSNLRLDLDENIVKEYNSYQDFKAPSDGMASAMAKTAMCMTQEILSTTLVELPSLLSELDLINSQLVYKKRQLAHKAKRNRKAKSTSTFEPSNGDLRSISVSKTNHIAEQEENVARHENIIQAVIRHNRSNICHHENVKYQKQVEAERTLEHLQTSIEFLIEVLDECNKE